MPRLDKGTLRVPKIYRCSSAVCAPAWNRTYFYVDIVGLKPLQKVFPRLLVQGNTEMVQSPTILTSPGTVLPDFFWKQVDNRIRIQSHRRKRYVSCAILLQPFSRKQQYLRIEGDHLLSIFHI